MAVKNEPGVLSVLTYKNAMKLKPLDMQAQMKAGASFLGEYLPPLQDNKVLYFGQFIAVVVAESTNRQRQQLMMSRSVMQRKKRQPT